MKKLIKERCSFLYKDAALLLVISILFLIISLIFIGNGFDDYVLNFFKNVVFILLSVFVLLNKKEEKIIGYLSIVISILLILNIIIDGTMFGIIYFLLGVFYSFHSVKFLFNNKNNKIKKEKINKKSCILTFFPVLISLVFFRSILLQENFTIFVLLLTFIIIINLVNIIFCFKINKKFKSIFIYIIIVVSFLIFLISTIFLIDQVGAKISKYLYHNSKEYIIESCKNTEIDIRKNITLLENLVELGVVVGENKVILLEDYLSLENIYWTDILDLKEKGYNCDGYVNLKWKANLDITSYYDVTAKLFYPFDMEDYFEKVDVYVNCSGKYEYKTDVYSN